MDSPFCEQCGCVRLGRPVHMVGAYPCRCRTQPKRNVTTSRNERKATVDETTIRRLVREEIEPALQRLPASDAERLARDYLDSLDENAKDS